MTKLCSFIILQLLITISSIDKLEICETFFLFSWKKNCLWKFILMKYWNGRAKLITTLNILKGMYAAAVHCKVLSDLMNGFIIFQFHRYDLLYYKFWYAWLTRLLSSNQFWEKTVRLGLVNLLLSMWHKNVYAISFSQCFIYSMYGLTFYT